MPTNLYPIQINDTPADKILELTVVFTATSPYTDDPYLVDIVIVNGKAIEQLPFQYLPGEPNTLRIIDMTRDHVYVIFTSPTDLRLQYFSVVFVSLNPYTRELEAPLLPVYQPLHNYYDNNGTDITDDRNYNSPFSTQLLNITEKSVIDLKLQPTYDGTINMIWTDDVNPMRIVNSRFAVDESGTIASLVDRRSRKDANTYNDLSLHQTELIPRSVTIPTLTFNGFIPGGILPGGGYRYFFRYITADGAETDIIEESRLVSVHEGSTTITASGSSGKPTSNTVSFSLTDLDTSFYGLVVYYTISAGDVDSVDVAYKIDDPFIIENDGVCTIMHTGYETKTLVDIESLSLTYSIISRSKTLDVVNNRLLVGNSDTLDVYNEVLAEKATILKIEEGAFNIDQHSRLERATTVKEENNYSNSKFIYNSLGYWKGETYELGIVYITDNGLSPVYPIQGIDTLSGGNYNDDILGSLYRGFSTLGQNALGIFRTANRSDLWAYTPATETLTFSGTKLKVDISGLEGLADTVTGFFFVRRPRKKDIILQGLMTPVAAVPIETKFGSEYEISGLGNYCGVGVTSDVAKGNVKFVPAPGGMMPFGAEEVDKGAVVFQNHFTPSGAQNTTLSVFTAATVEVLSTVGLKPGDSIRFGATMVGTIASVDYSSYPQRLTLTAAPGTVVINAFTPIFLGGSGITGVSTDFYIKAPIKDYDDIKSFALYSPDIECAPSYYASVLNGSKVGIACPKRAFTAEQVEAVDGPPLGVASVLYHRINGSVQAANSLGGDRSASATYIDTGAVGCSPKSFSGVMDRNLYCYWGQRVGSTNLTSTAIADLIAASTTPFSSGNPVGMELAYRPGNALAYGRYIGLKLDGSNPASDLSALSLRLYGATDKNTHCYNSLVGAIYTDNGFDPQLGYVTNLYSSTTGNVLGPESWKARYLADEDTEYTAVTKRFRYSDYFDSEGVLLSTVLDPYIDIYGGDCFLGLSWKQVWQPLGIAEAPQSNDITAYKSTRRSLGLLSYGYAIPVPAQSNFNFNVRSKERTDEREYKVYGTDRSFLPIKGKDSIRGGRQFETGAYNKGYSAQDRSAFKQFRLNLNAPFYRFKYPNRVYASAISSENEFVNGFSNFKGLNFKDYNTNMGAITKLICLNNVLVAVFKDGVAQIGVDERSVLSQATGDIFIDNAQVLSRSNMLNSEYGCSHLHGVCTSNNFVYGIDFTRLKIWRTNGEKFEIISDMRIQNKLGSISKELLAALAIHSDNSWIDIFSHFDSRKNEIYFTFVIKDPDIATEYSDARTLVYNETVQIWICETDDTRKFLFQSNSDRYAFPSTLGKYNKLYKYEIGTQASTDPSVEVFGEYNKFYDEIYDMYFDYHVIDEQALFKIFTNIYIVGNNSLPSRISYTSDYNSLTDQILKPYTNIRYGMINTSGAALLVSGVGGTQILTIQNGPPEQLAASQRSLTYGDFISIMNVNDAHAPYNYVVIDYNPNTGEILVNKFLPVAGFNGVRLYYGYGSNYPMRLNDSSFEESYGVISCQFNNRTTTGMSAAKLRGKWMRFRQRYEGTAPVYISGIITDYGVSLS
jgi:hypothetical protein